MTTPIMAWRYNNAPLYNVPDSAFFLCHCGEIRLAHARNRRCLYGPLRFQAIPITWGAYDYVGKGRYSLVIYVGTSSLTDMTSNTPRKAYNWSRSMMRNTEHYTRVGDKAYEPLPIGKEEDDAE